MHSQSGGFGVQHGEENQINITGNELSKRLWSTSSICCVLCMPASRAVSQMFLKWNGIVFGVLHDKKRSHCCRWWVAEKAVIGIILFWEGLFVGSSYCCPKMLMWAKYIQSKAQIRQPSQCCRSLKVPRSIREQQHLCYLQKARKCIWKPWPWVLLIY